MSNNNDFDKFVVKICALNDQLKNIKNGDLKELGFKMKRYYQIMTCVIPIIELIAKDSNTKIEDIITVSVINNLKNKIKDDRKKKENDIKIINFVNSGIKNLTIISKNKWTNTHFFNEYNKL